MIAAANLERQTLGRRSRFRNGGMNELLTPNVRIMKQKMKKGTVTLLYRQLKQEHNEMRVLLNNIIKNNLIY